LFKDNKDSISYFSIDSLYIIPLSTKEQEEFAKNNTNLIKD
jgi:hypothetical protein